MKQQFFVTLVLVAVGLSLVTAVTFLDVLRKEWEEFKAKYNKTYADQTEDKYRFQVFLENKHTITKHNQRHANGLHSYTLGLNKYADMTHSEFVRIMNGYRPRLNRCTTDGLQNDLQDGYKSEEADIEIPKFVDWRQHGYVTPVKDQGYCGSCWAFSATGALEDQHARKTGNLISLSEQNLVDCTQNSKYENAGCSGGWMANAFRYIIDNHGIDTEESYPYEGIDGSCRFKNSTVGTDEKGYIELPSGDEKKLTEAIATKGSISIGINSARNSFRFYESGVYDDPTCMGSIDHAMLAVGYGTDPIHGDYYLVKNSWSETWGESGYIRMARNKNNLCCIATVASYPVV